MRLLWAILVLFSLSNIVHGQTPSEVEPTVEALLIRANSKKALAVREIDQSPALVRREVSRIMTTLDSLFQKQIQERFNEHYEEVKQSLSTVSLPEDVSSLEVTWKQWKGVYDSSDLDALLKDFVHRAQTTLEPHREDLARYIDSQLKETLPAELEQAQNTIRARFQKIIVRHFSVWDVPYLHAPRVPELPQVLAKDYLPNVGRLTPGLAGLLLISLRRQIVKMVSLKMAGKAASKFIPVVGFLALLYEGWTIAQAKADLERELRTQFFSTYQEEFSPTTIWNQPVEEGKPSARQQIERQVSTFLQAWSEHCREEVERMLDAAHVFYLSPNAQSYISEQTGKGRNTQEIIENMHLVGDVFGPDIIIQAPLGDLLTMIVNAPDKQELSHLASELDTWLLQEYEKRGKEVLVAANRLGVSTFLEVVRGGEKLDWYDVHEVFQQYPRDLSKRARRGLVLALSEQVATPGIAPATLENIARHEKLFQIVAPVRPDTEKLFGLFSRPSVVDIVDRAYQKNAEVAQAFLNQWDVRTWERYRARDRFNDLLAVADYRLREWKQTAHAFASEISERDNLTPIFADAGLCGVRLWDTYAGPTVGRHQRKVAENAISLSKEKYPCDVLQTPEGLSEIQLYHRFTFGTAPEAFQMARPFWKIIYVGTIVLVILLLAVPTVRLLRKLGKRDATKQQQTKDGGTGGASQLPPSPLEPKPLPGPSSSPQQSLPPPSEPETQ